MPSIKSDFFKFILWHCLLYRRRFFFCAWVVSARNRAESAEATNRRFEKVCFYRDRTRIIWESPETAKGPKFPSSPSSRHSVTRAY